MAEYDAEKVKKQNELQRQFDQAKGVGLGRGRQHRHLEACEEYLVPAGQAYWCFGGPKLKLERFGATMAAQCNSVHVCDCILSIATHQTPAEGRK